MKVLITEWALASYTEFVGRDFSEQEYWEVLRPDILRLYQHKTDACFQNAHFWGPAETGQGKVVQDGWKMKWHNIGHGRIQLRLGVALLDGDAYLCHAWSKTSGQDYPQGMVLKNRIQKIKEGNFSLRGVLHEPGT